jgi:thymidylate synthase
MQHQCDLRGYRLPMLTTRKLLFRWMYEELLWFISGSMSFFSLSLSLSICLFISCFLYCFALTTIGTDANVLKKKGITIWDGNTSREALDKLKLRYLHGPKKGQPYVVGCCGPIYGFQWRHFGAQWVDEETNYKGQGVDQLQNVINLIRKDPYSRRILLNSWNAAQLDQMVLPPCHVECQFFVDPQKKTLTCKMDQRSSDCGLGVHLSRAQMGI